MRRQAAVKPGYSGQCKRDLKAAQKRGKDMEKIKRLMRLLIYKLSSDVVKFERAGDRLLLMIFQSVAPQLRRYDV